MHVYFIGAGPGAHDLITVRGALILNRVPIVMYAGSLVPLEMLQHCSKEARLIDTSELDLEQQVKCYKEAKKNNHDVARLHSGDPAIYGAIAEQMKRLDDLGISYEVVPGVSSFTAAAATLSAELTKPEISQSIILTRVSGRASAVPESESISQLAAHRATMCIFLSGPHLKRIVEDLRQHYDADTPIALIYRASWPDERIHKSTLGRILDEVQIEDWKLTTILLVGNVLSDSLISESRLYARDYQHKFRHAKVR
jgi:precorrin-4/cobalt-precorrin-4 C11-methyltransferase